MLKNSLSNYGSVTKILHWLIFILIIGMLCLGFLMGGISDKALRGEVINIHKLIGLSILVLMLFRLFWALINLKPALPLGTPPWQKLAERIVQYSIYAALIAMPLSGWIMSVAAGYFPHLFGLEFGLPIPKSKAIDDMADNVHVYLAYVIIALISIHVLAALYHFFIKKDDVLQRMM